MTPVTSFDLLIPEGNSEKKNSDTRPKVRNKLWSTYTVGDNKKIKNKAPRISLSILSEVLQYISIMYHIVFKRLQSN